MRRRICLLLPLLLAGLLLMVSAHPGRTDANGGHYDHSTGEYHFHHGYEAHQHPNGICPYVEISTTSSTELTFEEIYNEGYSDGLKAIVEKAGEYADGTSAYCDSLYDENMLTTETSLEAIDYSEEEAYNEGFNQAYYDYQDGLSDEPPRGYVYNDDGELVSEEEYQAAQEEEAEENAATSSPSVYYSSDSDMSESDKQEAREQAAQARSYPYLYAIFIIIGIVGWILKKWREHQRH